MGLRAASLHDRGTADYEVATAVGVSLGLVSGVMSRAAVLEIAAEHIEELDEAELERRDLLEVLEDPSVAPYH